MGWFDKFDGASASDTVNSSPNKGSFSHELIAAAATYEAAKAYENHVAKNGQPQSHAEAKAMLAALAGGAVDKLIETKGLDFIDRQKAKRHAEVQVEEHFDEETYQTIN